MSTKPTTGDKATATTGPPTLSTDDLHHLLSNGRRRTILRVLDADAPLPKGDLAERVAAAETGKDVAEVDHEERKRALVSVHQCHAPKLLDARVLRETRAGYALGPAAGDLLPYLDGIDTESEGWVSRTLGQVVEKF